MKAFLLVFFVIAATFNAPVPCAHALGLTEDHAVVEAVMKPTMTHDAMHQHMGEASTSSGHESHTQSSHTDDHASCPKGCDGGMNCQGCFMTTASIDADVSFNKPGLAPAHRGFANVTADGAAAGMEPPPPRA